MSGMTSLTAASVPVVAHPSFSCRQPRICLTTVKATAESDAASSPKATTVRRKVVRRTSAPSPVAQEPTSPFLTTVAVEEEGVSWEGVAKVDRPTLQGDTNWGRIAALVGGDIAALLVFSGVGRVSHGLPLDWETVRTADPFIAGWLLGAYFMGGYGPQGQGEQGVASASLSALKSWAVGVPLGLLIRTYTTGHSPPQPFVIVSFLSTLVLLTAWRAAFTSVFATTAQNQGDKKGSVYELFQLLSSLVRRW